MRVLLIILHQGRVVPRSDIHRHSGSLILHALQMYLIVPTIVVVIAVSSERSAVVNASALIVLHRHRWLILSFIRFRM